MKRTLKRAIALTLALALSLSLALSAWAAEESAAADSDAPVNGIVLEEESGAGEAEAPVQEPEEAEASVQEPEEAETSVQEPEEAEASVQEPGEAETSVQEPGEAETSVQEPEEAESAAESAQENTLSAQAQSDKDLISDKEAFVCLGSKKTLKLTKQPSSPARFVSQDPGIVSVQKSGSTVVLKGVGIGRTRVEMRRNADNTLLDTVTVYGFRHTTTKRAKGTNTREKPANLTTSNSVAPTRTYKLICQQTQRDKPYKTFLAEHGCSFCAVSAVCQAMGATQMTVDWMMTGGLEEIAVRNGFRYQEDTLGFYGLQKVLEYGGISSTIYNWKDKKTATMEAAKEELVKSLSAGRPVLLVLDPFSEWNNIGPLCSALHCVAVVGIDSGGYVQILNSSYPHGVSYFKFDGDIQQVKITPGELLDHFVRHSRMQRREEDDFYFDKDGGLHTMVEVTCDRATMPSRKTIGTPTLSRTSFTYTGERCKPTVTIGNLKEGTDFQVHYSKSIDAGTATAIIAGAGDYCGLKKLTYTIKKAPVTITADSQELSVLPIRQTVALKASASNNGKIHYASNDKKVTVSSAGVVTVSANYEGKATLTLTVDESDNYCAAKKTITIKVSKTKDEDKKDEQSDESSGNSDNADNADGQDSEDKKDGEDKDSEDKKDGEDKDSPQKRLPGKVTASDKTVTARSKAWKLKLNARADGKAELSYASDNAKVKINGSGVVTIPGGYVGVVKIIIRSAATDTRKAAKKTIRVKVCPAQTKLTSVRGEKSGQAVVKWKADRSVTGYELQYWSPRDGKGKRRAVKVRGSKKASATLKKLKANATYQIRLRSYKKAGKTTLYSAWSAKKSFKGSAEKEKR